MTVAAASPAFDRRSALAFIIAFGIVSLFADAAYEGMRGISGPFLATLGASGFIVGAVAGVGELFGYLLRLVSGSFAQRTRAYWPIAFAGYVIQMSAVPLLALAGNWWIAAAIIVLERTGKAVRNPAANTMMSHAGEEIGQGWAFGLHEAMDQTGALAGPLITALVLAHHGSYRDAFLWLGIPATLTVLSVVAAWMRFPSAGAIAPAKSGAAPATLSPAFWLYAASAALVAFGFADWPLIAYHFGKHHIVSPATVPVLYAVAMGATGVGALVFGRLFDSRGFGLLIPVLVLGAAIAPLAFLGGPAFAIAGAVVWGIVLGVENSVMTAGVARLVAPETRARAFGIFSAVFGIAWFAGSTVLGALYDRSLIALVAVASAAELAAIVPLILAMRATRTA